MPPRYVGGYRIDKERPDDLDASSLQFDLQSLAKAAKDVPKQFRLVGKLKRDQQGAQGACGAHAATCACEGLHLLKLPQQKAPQFSRQYQYIGAQQLDGLVGSDSGSTIEGNVRWTKETGLCLETLWPYTGEYVTSPPGGRKAIAACRKDAASRRVGFHKRLRSYADVWSFLSAGLGFLLIGIPWNDSISDSGVISRYDPYAPSEGGHALAIMGWFEEKVGGRHLVDLWNWWPNWGDKYGCAAVVPSVVDTWCKIGTVIGVSDLSAPQKRSYDWYTEAYNDATADYYDDLAKERLQ